MNINKIINVSALKKAVGKDGLVYSTTVEHCIFWNRSGHFAGMIHKDYFGEITRRIPCQFVEEIPQGVKNVLVDYHSEDLFTIENTRVSYQMDDNRIVNFYKSIIRNVVISINSKYVDIVPKSDNSVLHTSGQYKPVFYRPNLYFNLVIMPIRISDNKIFRNMKHIGQIGLHEEVI